MIIYDNFIDRKVEVNHFEQMFKFPKEYCFCKKNIEINYLFFPEPCNA